MIHRAKFKLKFSREFLYEVRRLRRKWSRSLLQIIGALGLTFASLYFYKSPLGQSLELFVLKQFFSLRGSRPSPTNLLIVKIDDKSYQALQASPKFAFPRKYVAEALRKIVDAKPRLIIVDANIPTEPLLDPQADALLETGLKDGPTTIWTGELPKASSEDEDTVTIRSDVRFRKAAKLELPMSVSTNLGQPIFMSDVSVKSEDPYLRVPIIRALVELAHYSIETPGRFDLINFYGPKNTLPSISLSDIVLNESENLDTQFHGKVIFLGYQSLHYGKGHLGKDEFSVPLARDSMFGVEVHGNLVGNLLDRSWLRRINMQTEISLLFLIIFIMSGYAMRSPSQGTIIVISIFCLTYAGISYLFFATQYLWCGGLGTLLFASMVILSISIVYFFRRTESYKKYIDKSFGFERDKEI